MGKLLEAFAEDRLITQNPFFESDSPYGVTIRKLVEAEDRLRADLNQEEKKKLSDMTDLQSELTGIEGNERFISGYRLGVLMTMEVFAGCDGLITG